jgi:hypothetical protein
MEKYWDTRPRPSVTTPTEPYTSISTSGSSLASYAQHRQMLLARGEEGWVAELGRYIGDLPRDVSPEMDVVKYWQVRVYYAMFLPIRLTFHNVRTITPFTQHSDELPSISCPAKLLLSLVNDSSLLASRLQQIGVRDSARNDSRNFN